MAKLTISRYKRKSCLAILLLLLAIMLLPVSAFAAELPTTTAVIPVVKTLAGDTPESAERFTFVLAPDDEDYPMPEGVNADTLTITGAGSSSFGPITFSEPGNYTYTVKEVAGTAANYTYDTAVYRVTVYVTTDDKGNLTDQISASKNSSSEKADNIVFTNTYKKTVKTDPEKADTIKTDPDTPKTGDTSNLPLWIFLAAGSAYMLLLIAVKRIRRKQVR